MKPAAFRDERDSCAVRPLACAGLSGIALFVTAILALHGLQPDLSPFDEAMSYYVHGVHGWLVSAGLVGLGVGSAALTAALALTLEGPGGRAGIGFLGVWSIGAVLGGVFPADPPGHWDQPPSASGAIHGIAALVAIVALPIATVLLARAFRKDERWQRIGDLALGLAIASVVSLIAFAASLVPVFISPGPPVAFGLTERVLFAVYVSWLGVVAIELLRRRVLFALES